MAPEGVTGAVDQTQSSGAASGAAAVSTGSATGSASGASTGSGSPTLPTKWEDDPRAKGILSDLQKERKARQEFEKRVTEAEVRAAERDRQIAALTNTRAPTADEADIQQVRNRFNQLYPHLGELTADDIKALKELKNQASDLQQATRHHWTEHSKRMLATVYEKIGAEIGDLTPSQQRKITALYVADAESNPEFMQRHDAGDKTLIDEFVKSYVEDIIEPVRRKTTASEVSRNRAVPSGGNRILPHTGGKPIDVKDDKAVMDFIMESRKGQFKR